MKTFKLILVLALYCLTSLVMAQDIFAHSGGLNSSGCHNCNVGSCAGTYHCHGGSGGDFGAQYTQDEIQFPTPQLEYMPKSNAVMNFEPDDHGSYTVTVDWDRPDGYQWSIALSKQQGADPGMKTNAMHSKMTFFSVRPGKWYVNIKEGLPSGYWSEVSYWSLELPEWSPPTAPVIPHPNLDTEASLEEMDSEQEQGNDVVYVMLGLSIVGAYIFGKSKTSS